MTTSRGMVQISLNAFDVLWQTWCLDVGPSVPAKPLVLDCGSPGVTPSERRRIEQFAYQELEAATAHLGGGGMRQLHPVLKVLAWPEYEINLRWQSDTAVRAMAASRHNLPVLAWLAYPMISDRPAHRPPGMSIWFVWGESDEPAVDLVRRLPERPAGHVRARSQSVDVASLRKARALVNSASRTSRQQPWSIMRQALRQVGVGDDASRAFANLADQECKARGEFRVVVPGRFGGRRASSWIRVNDTDKGRYLLTIDDRGWITMRGATKDILVNQLRQERDRLMNHR